MAERDVLWGRDLDDPGADVAGRLADVEEPPLRNGRDPITEPIPVIEADDDDDPIVYDDDYDPPAEAEPNPGDYPVEIGKDFTYAGPFLDRSRRGSPVNSLTFKPAAPPWYRTKVALIALPAVVVVAVVLTIMPLVLRSPAPGTEDSPAVTPSTSGPAPSDGPPSQNTDRPTVTGVPAPPPPPSPPPAPPAQDSPPVVTRQYPAPRYNTPPEQQKPEVGVTRAPMSVAPQERTPPTSAKVGEGRQRRGFF